MKTGSDRNTLTHLVFMQGLLLLSFEMVSIKCLEAYFGSYFISATVILSSFFLCVALGNRFSKDHHIDFLFNRSIYINLLLVFYIAFFNNIVVFSEKSLLYFYTFFPLFTLYFLKYLLMFLLLFIPNFIFAFYLPFFADQTKELKFPIFYAVNTIGGITGLFLFGIYLIPVLGISLNFKIISIIYLIFLVLFKKINFKSDLTTIYSDNKKSSSFYISLFPFLTGMVGIGYEIVIIRLTGMYYILTDRLLTVIFLLYITGLAAGSLFIYILGLKKNNSNLSKIEYLRSMSMFIPFAATILFRKSLNTPLKFDIFFLVFILVIPALISGISFSFLEGFVKETSDVNVRKRISSLYFFNSIGAAFGVILFGLFIIPHLLIAKSLILLSVISFIMAFFILMRYMGKNALIMQLSVFILVLFLSINFKDEKFILSKDKILYFSQGVSTSVCVLINNIYGKILMFNNYYILGSTEQFALRLQYRQGIFPFFATSKKNPSILKIGTGTGLSLSAMQLNTSKKIDAIEIVPELKNTYKFFSTKYTDAADKNNNVIFGDGRFLLKTIEKKYDIIVGELYSPQISNTSFMYSLEHLKNIKDHLSDKGIFCQFLQLGQFTEKSLKIFVNTFHKVFPDFSLWSIDSEISHPVVAIISKKNIDLGVYDSMKSNPSMDKLLEFCGFDGKNFIESNYIFSSVSFVTSDKRDGINTLDNSLIENIPLGKEAWGKSTPLEWLISKRRYPDEFADYPYFKRIWAEYGNVLKAKINIEKGDYYKAFQLADVNGKDIVNSSISIEKAAILERLALKDLSENGFFRRLPPFVDNVDDKLMPYIQANLFLTWAANLDKYNYNILDKLIRIKYLIKDKEASKRYFKLLWKVLPDDLKIEGYWINFKEKIENMAPR